MYRYDDLFSIAKKDYSVTEIVHVYVCVYKCL